MFLIALKNSIERGAFSTLNSKGEKVLFIFQEFDDALRFSLQLEEKDFPETQIYEYEKDVLLNYCKLCNTKYTIITPEDIVVPPV
jgi:hypothetical protein